MKNDGIATSNAISSLPDTVTIGAITYGIEKCNELSPDKNGEFALGEFYELACKISILKSHVHSSQVVVTVLHEIIHAITCRAGFKGGVMEERFASALAYGITDVLKQNPQFIDWIKRVLINETNK